MGCHFLLQCVEVKSESEVAQSCLILSDPEDCSPPGSSVHEIFQARELEQVPLPSPSIIMPPPKYTSPIWSGTPPQRYEYQISMGHSSPSSVLLGSANLSSYPCFPGLGGSPDLYLNYLWFNPRNAFLPFQSPTACLVNAHNKFSLLKYL